MENDKNNDKEPPMGDDSYSLATIGRAAWHAASLHITTFKQGPINRTLFGRSDDHRNWIIPGLLLGALPLNSIYSVRKEHVPHIMTECMAVGRPLRRVISVVESFELEGLPFGIRGVSPHEWRQRDIPQTILDCHDQCANIPNDILLETIETIHRDRQPTEDYPEGGSVFIHCRSGKGRSTTVVIMYLLTAYSDTLSFPFTLDEAIALVRAKRHQIDISERQLNKIDEFVSYYRAVQNGMHVTHSDPSESPISSSIPTRMEGYPRLTPLEIDRAPDSPSETSTTKMRSRSLSF